MRTLEAQLEEAENNFKSDHDCRERWDENDGCQICQKYYELKHKVELKKQREEDKEYRENIALQMDDDSGEPETLISDEPNDIDN